MTRGWFNMPCWNGLGPLQQYRLIHWGNLPIDYVPQGDCPNGAEVEITTMYDESPGPRFYCRACAAEWLLSGALPDVDDYSLARLAAEEALRERGGET